MIDFRYHVISIIAVFLALGLGILMGTTVLDRAVVDGLEAQIRRLGSGLEDARGDILELRDQVERSDALLDALAPWAVEGRLGQRPVLFLYDGGGGRWRAEAQTTLLRSGAEGIGLLEFTDKWALEAEGSREELELVVASVMPGFEPEDEPAEEALNLLGQRLLEPTGRVLLQRLAEARFVTVERTIALAEWPPADTLIVALAAPHPREAPNPGWLSALTRGTATVAPTLVLSGAPGGFDAVTVLRNGEATPSTLSTFDTTADDPTGAGAILALIAALHREGGHFGTQDGLPYLPDPPREQREPVEPAA